jgi:hypothetical protein
LGTFFWNQIRFLVLVEEKTPTQFVRFFLMVSGEMFEAMHFFVGMLGPKFYPLGQPLS